ncbi:alanine racemase [Sulfurovum sp. XTW-4]|uniref:Alanine racemase n=1 Tax=Sulfurovum xiamenensis TaxID=3019066 RepID=A0ABT7QPN6_9BACT|nr:alanine racemase [Sulfurovum xiamenensis]MDM5263057.1 alanine racemase [Sulfurovum xiamenensis]
MAFIKINKQNFYHNLNQIALKTGSVEKIAIVLKDNAYGHGLELMGKLASEFGIRHAVVRKTAEAEQIRSLFETILILGDSIIKDEKYSFTINTLEDIKKAQKGAKVELKVDTGMHRNGIALDELDEAFALIEEQGVDLIGVMTHYRSSDELSSEFFWQQKQFETVKQRVKEAGFTNVRVHSHNTAAILRSKSFDEDLVRVGIGIYGYNELPHLFDEVTLYPVMSLHAKKISSKVLKAGERIGYGGDFIATEDMTVSTYDLGYGDGWSRGNSAQPYVTSEGLPVLGRVSMDSISLESDKEEVCVMDDAQVAAKQFGTISYEVTTGLSADIAKEVI